MTNNESENRFKMSRREIREAVFKLVYTSEFNTEEEMDDRFQLFLDIVLPEEKKEKDLLPSEEDIASVRTKYRAIREKAAELDELINKSSDGWKTRRMSKVDLSILRVAVYEMIYDDTVPVGVAINEAVEGAKKYGGDDSSAFINGILGKMAKEKRD